MSAAAKIDASTERVRKPRARGFRVVQLGHAGVDAGSQRELLATLQTAEGRALARREAVRSMATALDTELPFFCDDCKHPTLECVCQPHGWED